MAKLSDLIEEFIKEILDDSQNNVVEIQRNELANYFSCAPSQINYVLTTRFTKEKGYYIESRRGGGGCIKINKIEYRYHRGFLDILNEKIGDSITYDSAISVVESLREAGIITVSEENIINIVLNDRTLNAAGINKNNLRADILKSVIFNILN
ncbi:CtsR family transcriptional regulator [Clostridium ihumii]|uniref:CtsR family transcriptional regulator n=1 Tax=Clostridium ihumii TaxID=1470356 RepID=UPI000550933B|nr:CtsR family transcriptional regulator [Clostridium ihumii]